MKNYVLAGLTLVMVMSMANSSEACFRWGWRRSARISYRMAGYRGHFHRAWRWGYGGWGGGYRGFYAGYGRGYGGYGGFGGYGGYGGGYGGYGGCYGNVGPSFGGYYASAAPAYAGYYAAANPVCANGMCSYATCANGNCANYGCPNGMCGPSVQSYASMIPAAPRISFVQKVSRPAVMTASLTPASPAPLATSAPKKSFLQKYASTTSEQPAPKQPIYGSGSVVPNYSYSPAVSTSGYFASLDY